MAFSLRDLQNCEHKAGIGEIVFRDRVNGDRDAGPIASAVRQCTGLAIFKLESMDFRPVGSVTVLNALKECRNLRELSFINNTMGPDGAAAVADAMQNWDKLTTLNLSTNSIGEAGARALAKVLPGNESLQALILECNKIGPVGIAALAEAFPTCEVLHTVNLSFNGITSEAALLLADGLKETPWLDRVLIKSNPISDLAAEHIKAVLMDYDVKEVSTFDNVVSEEEALVQLPELRARAVKLKTKLEQPCTQRIEIAPHSAPRGDTSEELLEKIIKLRADIAREREAREQRERAHDAEKKKMRDEFATLQKKMREQQAQIKKLQNQNRRLTEREDAMSWPMKIDTTLRDAVSHSDGKLADSGLDAISAAVELAGIDYATIEGLVLGVVQAVDKTPDVKAVIAQTEKAVLEHEEAAKGARTERTELIGRLPSHKAAELGDILDGFVCGEYTLERASRLASSDVMETTVKPVWEAVERERQAKTALAAARAVLSVLRVVPMTGDDAAAMLLLAGLLSGAVRAAAASGENPE